MSRALCFPRAKAAHSQAPEEFRSPGARAASLCLLCVLQLCCLAEAGLSGLKAGEQPQEKWQQQQKHLQEHSRVVPQSETAASSRAVAVLDSLTIWEHFDSL